MSLRNISHQSEEASPIHSPLCGAQPIFLLLFFMCLFAIHH